MLSKDTYVKNMTNGYYKEISRISKEIKENRSKIKNIYMPYNEITNALKGNASEELLNKHKDFSKNEQLKRDIVNKEESIKEISENIELLKDRVSLLFDSIGRLDVDKFNGNIENYVNNKSYFMCGKSGTGKSRVAFEVAFKYISKLKLVKFVKWPTIKLNSYSNMNNVARELLVDIENKSYHLLIIDDLELDNKVLLEALIETIYNSETKAIITSNFDVNQLANFVAPKYLSRLKHTFKSVLFDGVDKRLAI